MTFFKVPSMGDFLGLLLRLCIGVSDMHHYGVMYWARVAGFDVTIDPLLPRSGRDFRVEAKRRLNCQRSSPMTQASSPQRCRLSHSSMPIGPQARRGRHHATLCHRGSKSRS